MGDVSWNFLSIVLSVEGEVIGAHFPRNAQCNFQLQYRVPGKKCWRLRTCSIYICDHWYTGYFSFRSTNYFRWVIKLRYSSCFREFNVALVYVMIISASLSYILYGLCQLLVQYRVDFEERMSNKTCRDIYWASSALL